MRRSIATVCLSGSLEDKLYACADAGFDGVEIFEPDLVVNDRSPEEIRALADRLGLSLDLYLVALINFGFRIFNNVALIRRHFI